VFVVLFVVVMFTLGWEMAGAFTPELDPFERFGLAFGIGAGLFTLGVFLGSFLGIPITLASGICIFAIMFVTSAWLVRRRSDLVVPILRLPRLNKLQIALIVLISVALAIAFAVAAYWPPYAWDSLAVWALKGRLIAATGTLAELPKTGWPFYPLNISLQLAFLYLLGGDFLQSIFPMYLLSLAALLIANLRHRTGLTVALACALFLVVTPLVQLQATIAYADLPFAFYYVGSAIYLYRFLTERKLAWLTISAILVGLAGWTRTESPIYFAINLAVLFAFTRPLRDALKHAVIYTGIFAALWLPWTIYTRLANYGDYFGFAPIGFMDVLAGQLDTARLGAILDYLGQRSVATQDWGLLWIALPVALLFGIKYWRMHAPLIILITLNLLAVIYTYYVATAQSYFSVDWWLATGFDRMNLHWIPLCAFYLGQVLGTTEALREK
jgi:hypothetical protein